MKKYSALTCESPSIMNTSAILQRYKTRVLATRVKKRERVFKSLGPRLIWQLSMKKVLNVNSKSQTSIIWCNLRTSRSTSPNSLGNLYLTKFAWANWSCMLSRKFCSGANKMVSMTRSRNNCQILKCLKRRRPHSFKSSRSKNLKTTGKYGRKLGLMTTIHEFQSLETICQATTK